MITPRQKKSSKSYNQENHSSDNKKASHHKTLPAPEAMRKAVNADGLRDMQGLAARFFGGRSAAKPRVARAKAD